MSNVRRVVSKVGARLKFFKAPRQGRFFGIADPEKPEAVKAFWQRKFSIHIKYSFAYQMSESGWGAGNLSYIALYRQWRPQRFDEVVGQDHISKTLKNAIKTNRIVHAYLFTGPRGTGKTSSAKIMAKAVNCLAPEDGEACNACASCQTINAGHSMDIIEIDAASNRGIDEIRDLREKVKYAPVACTYKVYIIDEVHMLTSEAFNALLKTLEEPPKHVIFILATTEPHKIPLTVLSRCQKFDFKRIGYRDIVAHLKEICGADDLKVQERALQMLAKKSEGSMRDALSLLDQCLSFAEGEITEETIATVLGTVDGEFIKNIVQAMAEKNYGTMMGLIEGLVQEGKDIRQFSHDLVEYFRNLVLVKLSGQQTKYFDLPDFWHEVMREQSALFSEPRLFHILEVLSEGETQLRFSSQPRITLELSIIKATGLHEAERRMPGENKGLTPGKAEPKAGGEDTLGKPDKPVLPQSPAGKDEGISLEAIREQWKKVLESVRKQRPTTYAYLVEGEPVEVKNGKIILLYKANFHLHMENLEQPGNKSLVEKVLLAVYQHRLTVQGSIAPVSESKNDLVSEVRELFGDMILEIKE